MSNRKPESKFEFIKTIIIAGALALGFRSLLFEPFNIPSGSMIPTLLVGDYLFVSKYSYGYSRYSFPLSLAPFEGRIFEMQPERGDVAVFRQPQNESIAFIKRIVGLPGDRIQVVNGVLRINDVAVTRDRRGFATASDGYNVIRFAVYQETLPNDKSYMTQERSNDDLLDNTNVFLVPEGHYFMMGDNRDNSRDSRTTSVGMVPAENLIGRAELIFFSHNSSASLWEFWKWPFAIRYGRLGHSIM